MPVTSSTSADAAKSHVMFSGPLALAVIEVPDEVVLPYVVEMWRFQRRRVRIRWAISLWGGKGRGVSFSSRITGMYPSPSFGKLLGGYLRHRACKLFSSLCCWCCVILSCNGCYSWTWIVFITGVVSQIYIFSIEYFVNNRNRFRISIPSTNIPRTINKVARYEFRGGVKSSLVSDTICS